MLGTHSAKIDSESRWFEDDLEIVKVNASYGWSADCRTRSLRRWIQCINLGSPAR